MKNILLLLLLPIGLAFGQVSVQPGSVRKQALPTSCTAGISQAILFKTGEADATYVCDGTGHYVLQPGSSTSVLTGAVGGPAGANVVNGGSPGLVKAGMGGLSTSPAVAADVNATLGYIPQDSSLANTNNDVLGAATAAQTAAIASAEAFSANGSNITNGTIAAARIAVLNQNTTGQAGTSLALAVTPTPCSGGQVASGVLANGNSTGCVSVPSVPGAGVTKSTGTSLATAVANTDYLPPANSAMTGTPTINSNAIAAVRVASLPGSCTAGTSTAVVFATGGIDAVYACDNTGHYALPPGGSTTVLAGSGTFANGPGGTNSVLTTAPLTGAVQRSQNSKNTDTLSAPDIGAVGDGSTNNDTFFTNAVSFFTSNGGGAIQIPQSFAGSNYQFHTPVSWPNYTTLRGNNIRGTSINFCATGAITPVPEWNFVDSNYVNISDIFLQSSCTTAGRLPSTNVFFGRSNVNVGAGNSNVYHPYFSSPSTMATVASIGSEQVNWFGGKIVNLSSSTAAAALYTSAYDYLNFGEAITPISAGTNLSLKLFGTDLQTQVSGSNAVEYIQDQSTGNHLYIGNYIQTAGPTNGGSAFEVRAGSTDTPNSDTDILSVESARAEQTNYFLRGNTAQGGASTSTIYNISLFNNTLANATGTGVRGENGVTFSFLSDFHNNWYGTSSVDLINGYSLIYDKSLFTVRTTATDSIFFTPCPSLASDVRNFAIWLASPYTSGICSGFRPTGTVMLRQSGLSTTTANGPSMNMPSAGSFGYTAFAAGDISNVGNQTYLYDGSALQWRKILLGGLANFTDMNNSTLYGNYTVSSAFGTPTISAVTPDVTGSTSYSYSVEAVGPAGVGHGIGSALFSISNGFASMDSTHCNTLTWSAATGAAGYVIYRTVGGATQGKITGVSILPTLLSYKDCGSAADGTSPGVGTNGGSLTVASLTVGSTAVLPNLSGTTSSIGGGALLAGACTSGTVAVTGSTTAMVVQATPATYPGDGNYWMGYVSTAGTVTVKVCAAVAGTPTASVYSVRVIQ